VERNVRPVRIVNLIFSLGRLGCSLARRLPSISHSLGLQIPQVKAGNGVEDNVESAKKLLALLFRHEEGPFPSDITVTIGRVITARQLDMCGNHGQLFGSLKQAFHDESASL
jgi:hypothetical protein